MPKQHKHRQGKIATGGHSTTIEGLMSFVRTLEPWPEIQGIRLGEISVRRTVGRSANSLKPNGEGGFDFKATRWSQIGEQVTGIRCNATNGRAMQQVILVSNDPEGLKRRLELEGLCDGW